MSLLNTKNPRAIQSLMTETIFDIGFTQTKEVATNNAEPAPSLKLYGDNKRNILFIVDSPTEQFFSKEAELAFLKTLGALQLALDDVSVINVATLDQQVDFTFVQKELAPAYCVFLGANPIDLQLNEYPENIWSNEGDSEVLKTYSFDEMLTDANKKKLFWNAVKLMNR